METIGLTTSLFVAFLCTVCAQNRPPSITTGSEKEAYILYDNGVSSPLVCKSSGTPTPSIKWYINSQPVNLNSQNTVSSDGTLQMQLPEEGYYQCIATNTYGSALSNVTWLRKLRTDVYQAPRVVNYNVSVGDVLSLPCTLGPDQKIIPAASYKWQTVPNLGSQETRDIILDSRIQMDNIGTLKFAYVVAEDSQTPRLYRCQLTNTESNILQTSVAFSSVRVNTGTQVQPTRLTSLFNYSWPSLALEREQVSLRCFFGGAQSTTISWKKPDGSAVVPTVNRYQIDTSQLLISNVQKSDEGVYTCTGSANNLPAATATVTLRTESAPYFASVFDGPHDVNVTVGDNVVINCNTYANPAALVSWFLNGQPFDSNNLKPKFKLSSDRKTLTISNVCKNCPHGSVGTSDLMVIQCNASNTHGYIYGNGYINVLDRTEITKPPVKVPFQPPKPAIFTCAATSDVATEVQYFWTRNGKEMYDGRINASSGMLYIDTSGDIKDSDFLGMWTCTATNGVSSANASAELFREGGGVSGAGVWKLWWIPFIVILLFLIAIALLLLICCCLYRNRGDAYPVDEEERKGGNDPVKELREIGFHDFQRPMDAPDGVILDTQLGRARHGPGSISSSIGKAVSDDEMSVDYSNMKYDKFTEDGSFIGQYNPNRRRIQMTQPGIPESSA